VSQRTVPNITTVNQLCAALSSFARLCCADQVLSVPHCGQGVLRFSAPIVLPGEILRAAILPTGCAVPLCICRCFCLQGEGHKQGPNLHGLLGRVAGTTEGFAYSAANKSSGASYLSAAAGAAVVMSWSAVVRPPVSVHCCPADPTGIWLLARSDECVVALGALLHKHQGSTSVNRDFVP